jgi:hypothetical protein
MESAIICICWKWEGEKKVYSLQWDKGNDKEMVRNFLEVANEADEMVAHNGDQFDLKWFNTRCALYGFNFPEAKTVDTLVIARRRFNFNSNRLDYIAKFLLGEGKIKTEFDLWKDICLDNSPRAMDKMIKYCKNDVRVLQRVWEILQRFHKSKTHVGVLEGKPKWTCPHDGSYNVHTRRAKVTAMGTRQFQMQCKDCGKYYTVSGKSHSKYLEAKQLEANMKKEENQR